MSDLHCMQLADLSCLVYQKSTNTYAPYNKEWIKEKIYILLRRQASKANWWSSFNTSFNLKPAFHFVCIFWYHRFFCNSSRRITKCAKLKLQSNVNTSFRTSPTTEKNEWKVLDAKPGKTKLKEILLAVHDWRTSGFQKCIQNSIPKPIDKKM